MTVWLQVLKLAVCGSLRVLGLPTVSAACMVYWSAHDAKASMRATDATPLSTGVTPARTTIRLRLWL